LEGPSQQGGVGTFSRQNRTLYVGRIRANAGIEQVIERHFEEWGEIERSRLSWHFTLGATIELLTLCAGVCVCLVCVFVVVTSTVKVLQSRGVAFVTYVSELNAQFAKEAMMCQSLEHDEVLNVRFVPLSCVLFYSIFFLSFFIILIDSIFLFACVLVIFGWVDGPLRIPTR
jgi:hypothetical protein